MQKNLVIEPKWIASLYALSATAVCILIFTYSDIGLINAFIKTFFTAISFYFLGIITSSLINFIVLNFSSDAESKSEQIERLSAGGKGN